MNRFLSPLVMTIVVTIAFTATAFAETPTNPPGSYYTSWLGNTYMDTNGNKEVTEELVDIAISPSPNSHVYSAGYAETWGGGAEYDPANGNQLSRYDRFNSGFGDPVTSVAADANYVYWGTGSVGLLRSPHNGDWTYTTFLAGTNIQGLCVKSGKLYISDYGNNLIRVFDTTTMTQTASWSCTHPTRITVDGAGKVWVVTWSPSSLMAPDVGPLWFGDKVASFSSTGTPGPSITDFDSPESVAVNNSGQLLVGGLNANGQIWIYNISGTPTKVGTFGDLGGIFGGTPGAFTTAPKLHMIRSIAVDASGNIYTGCVYGTFWGDAIEKWTSSGTLIWRDFAGTSLDCAGIDPNNETEVYSKFHHYSLDYSKTTPGTEWSLKGFTVNRFKYPNDYRVDHLTDVGERSLGAGTYRIGGKLFVARSSQGGYMCELYRQETATDGEVLVPSVRMATGTDSDNLFYNPASKTWIARPKKDGLYVYGSWGISNNGDLCTVTDQGKFVQYKFTGFDAYNNPNWDASTAVTYSVPEISALYRVYYDSDADVMYMAGDNPSNGDTGAFIHIKRFPNWSTGNRTSSWTATLPYNDQAYTPNTNYGGGTATAWSIAGNYIFVIYGYGHIRILDKATGNLVGTLVQNVNGWSGSGGQVDAHFGMTAFKRSNGEYVLLFENAAFANIMMIRWTPPGSTTTVATPTFSPVGGTYTSSQSVILSDSTSGAAIHYTTDGTTPTASSATYSSPISVTTTKTIKAIGTMSGSTNSVVASATYTINTGGPAYNGPHNIPGILQAEDYDTGGEGIAYHDTDTGNNGGTYRTDDVDIEACTDTGSGYNVGWTSAGEYLKYTVSVGTAGSYTVAIRVASITAGNTFHIENASGTNLSGTITCPNTGGWQTWQTVNATVTLPAGSQILKLVEDTGGYNFNYLTFTGSTPTAATPTFSPAAGTYTSAQSVTISDSTSGAVIHYTTDGSTPTASSTTYGSAIAVSSTKTIKAIAIASGYTNSAVASATYTISAASGSLTGSGVSTNGTSAAINLTTAGTLDWAQWGAGSATDFNHKSSGGMKISNFTEVGAGTIGQNADNDPMFSWTDGTPTGSNSGTTGGVFLSNGTGNGYSFTVPADTTSRTLEVYVYGWTGVGQINAHLSDSSAADYTNSTAWASNGNGSFYACYTLTYKAASASKTLTVKWTLNTDNGGGAVGLQAASLK